MVCGDDRRAAAKTANPARRPRAGDRDDRSDRAHHRDVRRRATDGPLQVALMVSAAFASLVALKNGYSSAALADAAIGGVTTAVGAIFILLSVGALIDA